MLKPSDIYSYPLPQERIAQRPVYPYDQAKLMVLDRKTQSLADSRFTDITAFLRPSDILVFNDSRVIPARIFGSTPHGGQVEAIRLRRTAPATWWCLARPLKKFQPGTSFDFGDGLIGTITERNEAGEVLISFSDEALLEKQSVMPIPPYIRAGRGDEHDRKDYQSNFAAIDGSVAAPTASLHFTPELLAKIAQLGCEICQVTLHVGPPSFFPLWRPDQDQQLTKPGLERYRYTAALLERLTAAKNEGRRVIAVGTTVVRALESMASNTTAQEAQEIETDLFISPGFSFKIIDAMVTNFHQPQSSHLLLVESFLGRNLLERAYEHALASNYRFLSYGDGMLIQ